MSLSPSSIIRVGTVLLIAITIPGCKTMPSVPLDTKTVKPIPLRAKFYFSPEFRETAYAPIETDFLPILVGETIVNGVNDVMGHAFHESAEISSIERNLSNQGFDVIVVPEIKLLAMEQAGRFWLGGLLGGWSVGGRISTIFQVEWTVSDVKGKRLWSDTITATYNDRCWTRWCFQELMEKTIKDQFQQALEKMTGYVWWN